MKQLGILPILLLLGVGITSGLAAAELTASQSVPSLAAVGETVQVTVMLTYNGGNATQVVVTPGLPPGVMTDIPGGQSAELYPGSTAPISYPIRAVQSGTYTIISQIAYAEDGTWRELLLEAPFTAEGEIAPPPQEEVSSVPGSEMPEGGMPGGEGGLPAGEMPPDGMPGDEGGMPKGGMPPGPDGTPSEEVPLPSDNLSAPV
ncbi:MAG TPA: hypothetical protein VLB04_09520 [Methanotrichaceae archaeon]|nr:hypothetical protein [Methanotrichaceae archaeon]